MMRVHFLQKKSYIIFNVGSFVIKFGDNFDCHGIVDALKALLSLGSYVSVWLFNMESIIQNQGFQHIVEKSLMCLDKKSMDSF